MKEENSVDYVPKTAQNLLLLTIIIFGIIRGTCVFFSFLTSGTIGRQFHSKKYKEGK